VLPFMTLHALDNVCGELNPVYRSVGLLCSDITLIHLSTIFLFAETFMGTNINAQQNCEAEYVRAIIT
jgi:hypothetical protein